MSKLQEAIEQYRNSESYPSSRSGKTHARVALGDLLNVAGNVTTSSLSRVHAEKAVASWRARKLSEQTVNNYKSALRNFGTWLYETRQNRADQTSFLKQKKTTVDPQKRRALTAAQKIKLLKYVEQVNRRDFVAIHHLSTDRATQQRGSGTAVV